MSDLPPPPIHVPHPPIPIEPELVPLERLPFPPFVIVMAAVTILAFLAGIVRVPHALGSAITYEHGKRHLAEGNNVKAAAELQSVVKDFPNARTARLDLVDAYLNNQQYREAAITIEYFRDEKLNEEEYSRVDRDLNILDAAAKGLR